MESVFSLGIHDADEPFGNSQTWNTRVDDHCCTPRISTRLGSLSERSFVGREKLQLKLDITSAKRVFAGD